MTSVPRVELSVVVPVQNDENRLTAALPRLSAAMTESSVTWEILLSVERSTDRTGAVAHSLATRLANVQVHETGMCYGRGFALREGLAAAAGEVIAIMDLGLAVPPSTALEAAELLAAHPLLMGVAGDRWHPESVPEARWLRLRRIEDGLLRALLRLQGLHNVPDAFCPFQAWRRAAVEQLLPWLRMESAAVGVEIFAVAGALGLPVAGLPVEWAAAQERRLTLREETRLLFDLCGIWRRTARVRREARPLHRTPAG